jgi:hypothetical protein
MNALLGSLDFSRRRRSPTLPGDLFDQALLPQQDEGVLHLHIASEAGYAAPDFVSYGRIFLEIFHYNLRWRREPLVANKHRYGVRAFCDLRLLEPDAEFYLALCETLFLFLSYVYAPSFLHAALAACE